MRMRPQPEPSTQEVLAGLVERVTYHNAENGFCVLRARARGHRDVVTVVGYAATISAGEWITASGEWVNDRTHGQQFKARFLRTSPPTSADGIEKYLSSGMIRGVGPVYAKKLVRAFGEKVFEVIETRPDRLREVNGIGPVRAASILAAWAEQKAVREINGLSAQPRRRHRASGADLQDLWLRRHPGHVRESIQARARYSWHWFQDRRRDRHEARHRKDGDDPGSFGDFLCADRRDGRGPLRFTDGRAGAVGREATRGPAATDPDCARLRAAGRHGHRRSGW